MKQKNPKDRALRLLAIRDRTTAELRQRLLRDGFDETEVESVLQWLLERNFLDDGRTAQLHVENRNRFRPLGRKALEFELKQKGVAEPIVENVLNSLEEDYRLAKDLAEQRLRRWSHYPGDRQRQKLGSFLARRGFSWEVVRRVFNEVFSEPLDTDL